jgi:hypothetical protein
MKNDEQNVVVKLSEHAGVTNTEGLHLYVVNATGKIVETAHFTGDEAVLKTPKAALDGQSKVYVAQALPKGIHGNRKNERTLLKMNAYEVVKNFNGYALNISRLPSVVINPFPFYNCLITGHVNKNFTIDGQTKNLPLCDLRVHICEVETEFLWPYIPIYYRRIPDWVLHEIAQKIVNVPPIPDPIGPVSFTKVNLPLRSLTAKASFQTSAKSISSAALPANVLSNLSSGSTDLIRQTMIDYHNLLYPYFCFWPIYWPWIYTCDEDTIVTTDCNGHFEMWENTFSEDGALNIYIWVEANINGQWVTVYRPPLPCYTWWDYQCNTDINITVTDPRVQPCNCGTDGPADAVWFRSIGSSASALHIEQGLGSTIALQGATLPNGGCTDIIDGKKISPFGSVLTFKLFCGANIFAAGVTHYRWTYTMVTDANQNPVSGSPTIIQGSVSRPYYVKISSFPLHYETHYDQLGAEGVGTDIAYRIPHHDVTAEPIPAADLGLSPEWVDMFFDSASIDSHSLTDGIYEFDLQLLHVELDGSFTPVSVNKETFQVSDQNIIGNSEFAPDIYLNINSVNTALADSYKMNVRIDNAPCVGVINDATIGIAKSGPCGFIIYSDESQLVHLSFEASHPRNFATFSFGLVKGDGSQATGINPGGYVISSVGIVSLIPGVTGTFVLSGGTFSDDFTVATLLHGCPGQAAFSENLYVAALATDGTNRLYAGDYFDTITSKYINTYDASDVNAFALSKT